MGEVNRLEVLAEEFERDSHRSNSDSSRYKTKRRLRATRKLDGHEKRQRHPPLTLGKKAVRDDVNEFARITGLSEDEYKSKTCRSGRIAIHSLVAVNKNYHDEFWHG